MMKAIQKSYIGYKYKDKDTDEAPEKPNICFFEVLITNSFQI